MSGAATIADQSADAGDGQGASPKSSGKKLIFLILGGVLFLAGGGGAFILLSNKQSAPDVKEEKKQTAFIDLKEMVVGMSPDMAQASSGIQHFMKIHIMLEVADSKKVPSIQLLVPRIEDLFQVYLRELRASDLQGSAAIFRLKEELLRRVNLAVAPEHVEAVLVKELLLQ